MKRVFIDGGAGTTGLRIHERLAGRTDITLVSLDPALRRDTEARRAMLNGGCDIAFLCLPDEAAIEAVDMIEDPDIVVLDTSTAHRADPRFVYGFPELCPARKAAIASAKRVAVPGCHASGFIALVYPLVEAGILSPDARLTCFSITGHSGGGRKMIAQYEDPARDALLDAPRQYGLGQTHKHLREMKRVTGLRTEPIFCPVVADYYSGMEVTVPIFARDFSGTIEDIRAVYARKYTGPVTRYAPEAGEDGFLSAAALAGRDSMEISVAGNRERVLLIARYDNLGKGASGAAVECLNLVLGAEETAGLAL